MNVDVAKDTGLSQSYLRWVDRATRRKSGLDLMSSTQISEEVGENIGYALYTKDIEEIDEKLRGYQPSWSNVIVNIAERAFLCDVGVKISVAQFIRDVGDNTDIAMCKAKMAFDCIKNGVQPDAIKMLVGTRFDTRWDISCLIRLGLSLEDQMRLVKKAKEVDKLQDCPEDLDSLRKRYFCDEVCKTNQIQTSRPPNGRLSKNKPIISNPVVVCKTSEIEIDPNRAEQIVESSPVERAQHLTRIRTPCIQVKSFVIKQLSNERFPRTENPTAIDVVYAAMDYLRKHPEAVPVGSFSRMPHKIAMFLGVPEHGVECALSDIHAVENGDISYEAMKVFPSQIRSTRFRIAMKDFSSSFGVTLTPQEQFFVAKRVCEEYSSVIRNKIISLCTDLVNNKKAEKLRERNQTKDMMLRERDSQIYAEFKEGMARGELNPSVLRKEIGLKYGRSKERIYQICVEQEKLLAISGGGEKCDSGIKAIPLKKREITISDKFRFLRLTWSRIKPTETFWSTALRWLFLKVPKADQLMFMAGIRENIKDYPHLAGEFSEETS